MPLRAAQVMLHKVGAGHRGKKSVYVFKQWKSVGQP